MVKKTLQEKSYGNVLPCSEETKRKISETKKKIRII